MDQQRLDMLKLTEAEIQKKFGTGAIMRYGDTDAKLVLDAIPTGALTLDVALGIGGIPRGRVIEVYGPESGGKTTLALHMVAEAQAMGGVAAFIDAEHALDPGYAARLGVDIDDILISQPDTGEQALEIVDMLVRSGAIDIIVIDSVAALVPRAEIEGEMGDATVGLHARLMSQALRKLTGSLSKSNTTCVFINQIREKIGGYGNPETTTGGRALKFFSSVRIEVRKKDYITDSDGPLGTHVVAKVVKNKVAPPFRIAEFDIIYGEGINKTGTILDLAANEKIVEKAGSWYSYGEDRLGQGREAAKIALEAKPEMLLEIENKVRDHYGLPVIKAGDRDNAMRPTPKPESKKKR